MTEDRAPELTPEQKSEAVRYGIHERPEGIPEVRVERTDWEAIVRTEAQRRRARRTGRALACWLFGHRWMGPWSISGHRQWCRRCGHVVREERA